MTSMEPYWRAADQKSVIERLICHRQPMILVDAISHLDEHQAVTQTRIGADSPFFRSDLEGVPSWVGLEYMAQTIAIWSGHQLLQAQQPIRLGFLLGSRRYQTHTSVFKQRCVLTTDIQVTYLESSGLSCFDCIISSPETSDSAPLASARINVFRPTDTRAFLETGTI